jgi:hypothetical protein
MESRSFIRVAAELITKIEASQNTIGTTEELRSQREAIQKEVSQLFMGLQNPTLPSAYRLRDVALRNGFYVDPKVQHRLTQFEFITG